MSKRQWSASSSTRSGLAGSCSRAGASFGPRRTATLAGLPEPEGWRQQGPVVKVMLLLDGLPDFPAWPGPEPWAGTIDIGFTLADLAAAAHDARAGQPAARPWIEAAC